MTGKMRLALAVTFLWPVGWLFVMGFSYKTHMGGFYLNQGSLMQFVTIGILFPALLWGIRWVILGFRKGR